MAVSDRVIGFEKRTWPWYLKSEKDLRNGERWRMTPLCCNCWLGWSSFPPNPPFPYLAAPLNCPPCESFYPRDPARARRVTPQSHMLAVQCTRTARCLALWFQFHRSDVQLGLRAGAQLNYPLAHLLSCDLGTTVLSQNSETQFPDL